MLVHMLQVQRILHVYNVQQVHIQNKVGVHVLIVLKVYTHHQVV